MKFKKPNTPGYVFEDESKMTDSDRTYIYPKSSISQIIPDRELSAWAASIDYEVGDRCYYTDGCAYECVTKHTSGTTFNSSYWNRITLYTELDAVNKKFNFQTICFLVDSWVGDTAPYTQSVAVTGFTGSEDEHPIISISYPSNIGPTNAEEYEEGFAHISKYVTGVNIITATCFYEKPTMNIYVDIMG